MTKLQKTIEVLEGESLRRKSRLTEEADWLVTRTSTTVCPCVSDDLIQAKKDNLEINATLNQTLQDLDSI